MRSAFAAVVLLVLGGCMTTPGPTTVHWVVSNQSAQHIAYTILLDGGAIPHQENGSLQPNQMQQHTMVVNGADLTAVARLQEGGEEAVLTSFAQPSCDQHRLEAVWDGTWNLRWHSADC